MVYKPVKSGRVVNYWRSFILQSGDNAHDTCTDLDVDDVVMEGVGYTDFFLSCVLSLQNEELIRCSPRRQRVRLLLDENSKAKAEVTNIAILLISKTRCCIVSGHKHKLSAAQGSVWSSFTQLHRSQR